MLGVFRLADARSRPTAARLGLAAAVACMGLSGSAGVSDAFATYGTYGDITIKKVNVGGDATDAFGFQTSPDFKTAGFSLVGGGTWHRQVSANGAKSHASNLYTVTEAASDDYELTSLTCEKTTKYGPKPDTGSTTSLAHRKATIKVGSGEHVLCTFTNTRKTGTIVVRKDLVPSTDAGRFDLLVGGDVALAQAGDEDASAPVTVKTGTHQIGEAGPALADYVRSTVCVKGYGKAETVVAQGTGGPIAVAVGAGDEITCTIKNVRKAKVIVEKHTSPADPAMPKTAFDFTVAPGGTAFSLTDGASEPTVVEPGAAYTITEADAKAKGYRLKAVACTKADGHAQLPIAGAGDVAARTATVTPGAGDVVTCSFTNEKVAPAIKVVKSGPATAYAGDTLTFGFAVTNAGNAPLHDIQVGDDRCLDVQPGAKDGADNVLDPGETWQYSCSMVAPAHAIGDANPVVNTVTAQGKDENDTTVQDKDEHATKLLHPAIDIEKTGPATATAGARLGYTLDVTNPGDMAFAAADVAVTDALCVAAPALSSTNGDATTGSLDPGDRWTYTCDVQSTVGQSSVVNVADVKGTDENTRTVTDQDTFTTQLTQPPAPPADPPAPPAPPAPLVAVAGTQAQSPAPAAAPVQQVAGLTVTSRPQRATASIRGPRACPRTRVVTATVTGRQIRRVTFLVDGRRVRTVTRADSRGRWALSLRTSQLRRGANRVTARVEFSAAGQARTRTLRLNITRCAAQVVRPQFTG
ncbi:MAG: hypothetical protein QOF29_509 [bacterium]